MHEIQLDHRFKDISGTRIGMLRVLEFSGVSPAPQGRRHVLWKCLCDCGTEIVLRSAVLLRRSRDSCGCMTGIRRSKNNIEHGYSRRGKRTREYRAWASMITRCYNPKNKAYRNYGGRGVSVCPEWRKSFSAFISDVGTCPVGKNSIGRINNNDGYNPGNVRWENLIEQANNKRNTRFISINGVTKTSRDWSEISGINPRRIKERIRKGWNESDAVFTPIKR